MKKIFLFIAFALVQFSYAQSSEKVLVVKSIAIDEAEGSLSPFINYIDKNGEEQWFSFILPEVGMDEYAEILIEDQLLIKVSSTYRFGDGPSDKMIDGYEFNEDVANSLVGKKIKIVYKPVDLTAYLYSIELIGEVSDKENFDSVVIGKQTWMTNNLSKKIFNNGDSIFQAKTEKEWQACAIKKTPAWCYVNFDEKTEQQYGLIYNWYAVSDPRGLAPEGWRIPNRDDFYSLVQSCGGVFALAGTHLKTVGVWEKIPTNYPSDFYAQKNNTNSTGFNAIPNGSIYSGAISQSNPYASTATITLAEKAVKANFWATISEVNGVRSEEAFAFGLSAYNSECTLNGTSKGHGFGVRCVK